MFAKAETGVLKDLELRVQNMTGYPVSFMEPFQLVKYDESQHYSPHYDYFVLNAPGTARELAIGGQRIMTILVYLLEPEKGGNTVFPKLGLSVPPKMGSALLWYNVDRHGNVDPRMEHGGAKVEKGTKIAMNIWIRQKPYGGQMDAKEFDLYNRQGLLQYGLGP